MQDKDFSKYTDSAEFIKILKKYEKIQKSGKAVFIDCEDLLDIVDYYHLRNEEEKAIEAANYCLEQFPDNNLALMYKARLTLIHEGDTDKAMEYLNRLKTKKDKEDAITVYGEVLVCQEKYDEADKIFLNTYNDVKEEYENGSSMDYDPDEELDDDDTKAYLDEFFLNVAILYNDHNVYDRAEKWIKLVDLEADERHFEYWDIYGNIYYATNRDKEAEKAWNKALDINPFSPNTWMSLVTLYFDNDDFENALKCLNYILAMDDKDFGALMIQGQILFQMQENKKAIQTFKKCGKIKPKDAQVNIALGLCYSVMNDLYKAKNEFMNAYLKAIDNDSVFYQLGTAMMSTDFEELQAGGYGILKTVVDKFEIDDAIEDCPIEILKFLNDFARKHKFTKDYERYHKLYLKVKKNKNKK